MYAHPALRKSAGTRDRRSRALALILAGVALAHLAGGACCLWIGYRSAEPQTFRPTAGVVLILLGLAQLAIARRVSDSKLQPLHPVWLRKQLFWRWLLIGLVVCYAGSLLLGSNATAAYVFWASLAVWYTAAQLPLVAAPALVGRTLAILDDRRLRALGWSLYVLLLLPLGAELSLRLYARVVDDPIPLSYLTSRLKLTPGVALGGTTVNMQGYWGDEFTSRPSSGTFRVAAIGDDVTLCGDARTNFLAQIERQVPGLEVYNFGIPNAGPREYAAQAAHEIARYSPDLVLAFVSVGTDITQETPLPSTFDCRSLHLVQLGALCLGWPENPLGIIRNSEPGDQQSYLRHSTGQLAVCRTPIDDRMQARWRMAFYHLDRLVGHCRRRGIAVALVLAPEEFQVNHRLLSVLRRRAGYRSEELDVQLPQRRLACYARQRDLPLLDLLPHLTGEGPSAFERYDRRLSDRGNAITAEVIGHWVQSHFGPMIAATTHVRR